MCRETYIALLNYCVKKGGKNRSTIVLVVNFIFHYMFHIIFGIFLLYMMYRHTYAGKIIHRGLIIRVIIHSSLCVMNFMLSTWRPIFTEGFFTTETVEQA